MIDIIFSILVITLLIVVGFNEFYQRQMKVSPMPTPRSTRKAMLAAIADKNPAVIAELGSGWGGIAIAAARRYPQAEVIGFEGSPMPYLFSRLRAALQPKLCNLRFVKQNFFSYDMQNVDVILCYLSNPHMAQLEPKLHRELKTGALVISSTFHMPHWPPRETLTVGGIYDTPVYIYEKTDAALPEDAVVPAPILPREDSAPNKTSA